MSRRIVVRAPAKINLHLGVAAPRADGFHPLDTVYQGIGVYDDVSMTESATTEVSVLIADAHAQDAVSADGVGPFRAGPAAASRHGAEPAPGMPGDSEDNLAVRAVRALQRHAGCSREVSITVHKSIPVAGGLAGGSADAAAALIAYDRLFDLQTSDDDILDLAADLGSDVPFALLGGTARGLGRGENVTCVPGPQETVWWIVIPSPEGLSTPRVYQRFDALFPDAPSEPTSAEPLLAALTGPAADWAGLLHNDLARPAFDLRPDLVEIERTGLAAGARACLLSGSGPTMLLLAGSADEARTIAGRLPDHPGIMVAPAPVAGAHVVDYA